MELREKFLRREHRFKGNIIDVETQYVELPNGKEATRDVVLHPGAAAVIPLTDDGYIYLVKQFRKPVDEILLEIPAGKLDHENEDPRECAARELKEETGFTAEEIRLVSSVYSCVGFSNEIIHIYLATGLKKGEMKLDEDEFLSVEKHSVESLKKMITSGEIKDGKTIIAIFAAERYLAGDLF